MENLNCNKVLKRALFFAFLFGAFSGCDRNEILKPIAAKEATTIKEEPVDDNSNKKPVIHILEAVPSSVRMGGKISLFCTASDPDGDELSYTWEYTAGKPTGPFIQSDGGGEFSGSNASMTWVAPYGAPCCVPGPYLIIVTVQDGKGGSVSSEIIVEVT